MPGPNLREPRNDGDVHVESGIQLNTVICPMPVISMEVTILGHVSFGWVCLHLR